MKVSGFTFIKDAEKFDFPIKESVLSVLPLCDEFIIGVGDSNDGTLELVKSIPSDKIKIIETPWGEAETGAEHIFAKKTNEMLRQCSGDWCFYIQGDEAIHEQDYDRIRKAMEDNLSDTRVEGLLFHYNHFFGTPDIVVNSYHWYQNEIRIIRNGIGIESWKDAQGFRRNGQKLHVKSTGAYVYHYGWTRNPQIMLDKMKTMWEYYHSREEIEAHFRDFSLKDVYYVDPYTLKYFEGAHPAVVREWVQNHRWHFKISDIKFKHNSNSVRKHIQLFLDRHFGIRTGEYKNYILIKR